ncbi:hypothetical protein [Halovivax sp.]|uniref:hypothetical protein n=1 Tax=Halovivax sp. TaxID=1935978 RepID=UPI0025C64A8F|nr:hypothetical protein [Halovivax sp.]
MTVEERSDERERDGSASKLARVRHRGGATVDRARTHPRDHPLALAGAVAVGLSLTWVHWFGLVLGGALVGLVAPSLRRGLLFGLGFGALVLSVFALTVGGSLGDVLAMRPVIYLTVGAALALPVFGSLVRGLG